MNKLISFLQSWGIILVVIGHSFYAYGNDNIFHKWIYSFHMPLFMFISGYLLWYSLHSKGQSLINMSLNDRLVFIKKKAKRLLIPYVVISTLAFIPKTMMSFLSARPVELTLDDYVSMLLFPWKNVIIYFWFLPTLFIIFVIVIVGRGLLYKINIPYSLVIIIALAIHFLNPLKNVEVLNLCGVLYYLIYFIIGYYFSKTNCEAIVKKYLPFILFFTISLSVIALFEGEFYGKEFLMAINGIVMSVALGVLYVMKKQTFLSPLYGASFAIYLFSWFPQVFFQQILLYMFPEIPRIWSMVAACLSGIMIPLYLYRLIVRYKHTLVGHQIAQLTGI